MRSSDFCTHTNWPIGSISLRIIHLVRVLCFFCLVLQIFSGFLRQLFNWRISLDLETSLYGGFVFTIFTLTFLAQLYHAQLHKPFRPFFVTTGFHRSHFVCGLVVLRIGFSHGFAFLIPEAAAFCQPHVFCSVAHRAGAHR